MENQIARLLGKQCGIEVTVQSRRSQVLRSSLAAELCHFSKVPDLWNLPTISTFPIYSLKMATKMLLM